MTNLSRATHFVVAAALLWPVAAAAHVEPLSVTYSVVEGAPIEVIKYRG